MKRIVLFTLVISLFAVQADAGMVVSLNDGVIPALTIQDNAALDTNPLVGMITYSGPVGPGSAWQINVTTGVSQPLIGGPAIAKMHLDTVHIGGGPGTLWVGLTDTGFVLPATIGANAVLISEFGGVTDGNVQLTQILDPDNTEFGDYDPYAPLLPDPQPDPTPGNNIVVVNPPVGVLGPGAFSDTRSAPSPVGAIPFSLTEKVMITHLAAGDTSFDAESAVVPVPAAVLLGILGLGVAGLKLRKYA